MRINKYLALCGVASRRACDEIIKEGRVKVNGKVAETGYDVDEFNDSVVFDGKKLSLKQKFEYYIMNKPKGYITSVKDDKGRKTVMDLLPKNVGRIYPVGRLDYDTEGLLIFTNDGDLTNRLTHPRNEVTKTYLVKTETPITEEKVNVIRKGVIIDGVKTKKCNVRIIETNKSFTKLHVTISEGRNRQVRKMFEAVNCNVDFLKRIKIGELTLQGLNRGEVRKLSPQEIDYLKNL
ncbi:MAG TPA: pseudouridine synthase [Clostridiales bacterium]|nr:pseudouridine synthase [Clostridiales bacterium]HBJ97920.1 pseudouridine synthase [Clostridiales bacterium]